MVRVRSLVEELRRLDRVRDLRDFVWWSAQDSADCANGKLSEALAELRAGDLGQEIAPSAKTWPGSAKSWLKGKAAGIDCCRRADQAG